MDLPYIIRDIRAGRYASKEKGKTLILLSGGTGQDVMAHDVTDPADVQTLGTLSGHRLAVNNTPKCAQHVCDTRRCSRLCSARPILRTCTRSGPFLDTDSRSSTHPSGNNTQHPVHNTFEVVYNTRKCSRLCYARQIFRTCRRSGPLLDTDSR